jgi:magnesium transporter
MLTRYALKSGTLETLPNDPASSPRTIWFDLVNPTTEEEAEVEQFLRLDVPTREEMAEIEASSRLYEANGTLHMTALVLNRSQGAEPSNDPVTFVMSGDRIVTVRYSEPRAFPIFIEHVAREKIVCASASEIFLGLVETIVWRTADSIERIQSDLNKLTHTTFEMKGGDQTRHKRLDVLLKTAGQQGELTFRANESVLSLSHLMNFYAAKLRDNDTAGKKSPQRSRVRTLQRDIQSLGEHTTLLMQKMQFVLDAILGMINVEENRIIKIFSVLATVFMPPTLVASAYGMNFKHMPELDWPYGYAWALFLMLASALGCYFLFRRKGWL